MGRVLEPVRPGAVPDRCLVGRVESSRPDGSADAFVGPRRLDPTYEDSDGFPDLTGGVTYHPAGVPQTPGVTNSTALPAGSRK